MIFHDFIMVEKEKSTSILNTDTQNEGIVKEIGPCYYTDSGNFVRNIRIDNISEELKDSTLIGKRILFSQHMEFDVDGDKIVVVRGRDVIKVWS